MGGFTALYFILILKLALSTITGVLVLRPIISSKIIEGRHKFLIMEFFIKFSSLRSLTQNC